LADVAQEPSARRGWCAMAFRNPFRDPVPD
jgi:hypothetical protein